MLKHFLPKETSFFRFFEQHSTLSMEACKEFNDLATRPDELALRVARIKQIEHRADDVTHTCINALHNTFITPIDRADIHRLMRRLDDIVDSVDAAASRMALYELTIFRPELKQLTEVLVAATAHIDNAVRSLPRLSKESDNIQRCCIAVYQAENDGDELLRAALVRLFKEETDAITIMKWKEIFERLERATDRCQEVANIISGIVIEAS
jgi:predicted phosphate transport protein (TIGR00153 family)